MHQIDGTLSADSLDQDQLRLLNSSLSTKLTKLTDLDTEIVELTPEEGFEEEIVRADEYTEGIQRALLKIEKGLRIPDASPPRMTPPPPRAVDYRLMG